MRWGYKTVHFELKKEGLLGGSFLDEAEIEEQLNEFGQSGWELISVIEVHNGIICFFRQPLTSESMTQVENLVNSAEQSPSEERRADKNYDKNDDDTYDENRFDPYQEGELIELDDPDETPAPDELIGSDTPGIDEYEVYEETNYDTVEDAGIEPDEDEPDSADEDPEYEDETDDYPDDNRIGAIRIE